MDRCSLKGSQCQGLRRGAWTQEEDNLLRKCIEKYGTGKWRHVPKRAGLNRCRKSCRLRWLNYLSPGIKRGRFDADEDDLIIRLHKLVGNRWSLIAGRLPGRTGNDVKNYWNSHLSKRLGADYKTRGVSAATVMRPQPQTISMDHRWSKDQTSGEAKHQEVKSESPIPPPALNNPTTMADDVIISMDHRWPKDQTSGEAKHQEVKSESPIPPPALNNPTTMADDADDVIICDGSKHATSHVGFMALELDANLRIDDNGGTGNRDLFLGGLGRWEDFLFDLNMWDDLGIV